MTTSLTEKLSIVTNQNRLTPIFEFFLFDKFRGNTLLHNVFKNLVATMSLYPSFCQLAKPAISHRITFQQNKPVINSNSAVHREKQH